MALIFENKNQEEIDALSAPRGNTITPDMITREALKPPPTEPLAQTFSIVKGGHVVSAFADYQGISVGIRGKISPESAVELANWIVAASEWLASDEYKANLERAFGIPKVIYQGEWSEK